MFNIWHVKLYSFLSLLLDRDITNVNIEFQKSKRQAGEERGRFREFPPSSS